MDKMKKVKKATPCNMCRMKTFWKCTIFNKFCFVLENHGWNGTVCVSNFPDQDYFGMVCCDN